MSRLFRLQRAIFYGVVFLLASATAYPQTEPDGSDRVNTNLVTVPLIVLDRNDHRVPGLSQADFSLLDNGRPVQPAFFAAGSGPVAVVFAVDDSYSVRELVAQQQASALSLLERFSGNTEVAVQRFGSTPRLTMPFSSDREALRAALTATGARQERTAIFDAALAAVKVLAQRPANHFERRIVILLSDGLDTASRIKPRQVIDEARAAGVAFYVVDLPLYTVRDGSIAPRPVTKGFRELAEQTGGMYLAGPKLTRERAAALLTPGSADSSNFDLNPLLQAIANDLSGQYTLAYYAEVESTPEVTHHVEVKLAPTGHKGLAVHVLRGDFTIKP